MTQIPNSKEPNKKRAHTFGGPFDQPRFYEIESRCQRLSSTFSGKIFGLCSPRLNNPITGSISKKNLHTRRTCPTTNPPQPPTPNPQPPTARHLPAPTGTHAPSPAPTAPTRPYRSYRPPNSPRPTPKKIRQAPDPNGDDSGRNCRQRRDPHQPARSQDSSCNPECSIPDPDSVPQS